MPAEPAALGLLLISGGHERAHYAFLVAAGAAALGRRVVLFATNQGCHALTSDWRAADPDHRDAAIRATGVAGLEELRAAARDLGARLIACEAGLRMAGIDRAALLPGVEVGGIATWLGATAGGQLLTL
jgi:peroxiredoxin family protein